MAAAKPKSDLVAVDRGSWSVEHGAWSVERAHRSRDEARQDSVPARSICFFCLLVYRPCVCTARLRPATCDLRSRLPCLVRRCPLPLPGPALPCPPAQLPCSPLSLLAPSRGLTRGAPPSLPGLALALALARACLPHRAYEGAGALRWSRRQPDWLPSRLRSLTSSPGLEQIATLARCISPFARTNKARPPLSPCRNWPAIRTVSDLRARTRKKKGLRQGEKAAKGRRICCYPTTVQTPKRRAPQYAPPMMMMMMMMSGATMIKYDDDDAPARPPARPALRKTPFRSVKHKNISQANLPTSCSAPTVTPRPPVGQKNCLKRRQRAEKAVSLS
ncbi:hypothetical protein BS50DRAFT_616881 [Corynespora cassiicola Philippines]|uniref:Uncharacterized protein n=1 Tax=Corynespora cassiicola Philippines TaxID=1448308 RepID=A0A2T2P755_CORCC|nr:hypothetical protein BS50DRAFT_616881 [Corynespora cassiicola Philippines]